MPDDKSQRGGRDRSRVRPRSHTSYFAKKHSRSEAEARKIVQQAGPGRAKADAAAQKLKRA